MKHTLIIVFGKEQVNKLHNNQQLTDEEITINQKEYSFATEEEKKSFINGINEAIGWTDYCIPELELDLN